MNGSDSKFTIYFEDPFWVGIFERNINGRLEVSRVVFGAEPKDGEIHHFLLTKWNELRFCSAIATDTPEARRVNPKRLQRMIHKETQSIGIGTKAQQALKLQMEKNKTLSKSRNHLENDLMNERQHQLQQQKRKEKHRGH